MSNRTLAIWAVIAMTAAVIAAVLVQPAMGPRASRADYKGTAISIEELHRQVDHRKLPEPSLPDLDTALGLPRDFNRVTVPHPVLAASYALECVGRIQIQV